MIADERSFEKSILSPLFLGMSMEMSRGNRHEIEISARYKLFGAQLGDLLLENLVKAKSKPFDFASLSKGVLKKERS